MELYIGGYAQGKLAYVMDKIQSEAGYDLENVKVYDNTSISELLELVEKTAKQARNACDETNSKVIVNKLHLVVKDMLSSGKNTEEIWNIVEKIIDSVEAIIIISDEIGNGIVPIDENERIYREETGRLLIKIAKKAKTVERILMGIGMKIK